jgi:hypothetical protein
MLSNFPIPSEAKHYELMKNRSKALESDHKDNPKCLERKILLKEWFGDDVV